MTDTPTLHELLLFLQDNGLVGEEHLGLCLAVSLPYGGFQMLLGPSSTGKTWTFERAITPYVPEGGDISDSQWVYEVSASTSPKALFYDADNWNAHPVHVWTDLASMGESDEAIAKRIGEGKIADHTLADVTSDGVKDKKLNPGRTDVIIFATDNEKVDKNDFAEVRNRAVQHYTDPSSQLTQRVVQWQADEAGGLNLRQLDEERARRVRAHGDALMRAAGAFQSQQGTFVNPVIPEITRREVIPALWPEARRDIGKLIRIMEAVALWNHQSPDFFTPEGKPVILVRPEDAWLAMKVFGERMVMSALNVSTEDVAIIELLRDRKAALSVSNIKQQLADPDGGPGINIASKLVRKALDGLEDRGYVSKDSQSSPVTYRAGLFAPQIERSTKLDWNAVLDQAIENVKKNPNIPDDVAQSYIASHCTNPVGTQPFTGEQIPIRDDDSFSGELAEAVREMEEVASAPMWGSLTDDESDDADPEPEPDEGGGSGQVTLS